MDCLKEALHSFCTPEFHGFIRCLNKNKNRKECDGSVGQYFICVERNMKNIYWSGSIYFWTYFLEIEFVYISLTYDKTHPNSLILSFNSLTYIFVFFNQTMNSLIQ